jgi:hypothetical protein
LANHERIAVGITELQKGHLAYVLDLTFDRDVVLSDVVLACVSSSFTGFAELSAM